MTFDDDFLLWQKKFFAETNINAKDFKNKTLFSSIDTKEINLQDFAGVFPYTRGIRASMYTHKPWTIRQYAGFSTAKESNNFYKNCLKAGQKGLSVAFDLPTHRGYDSDNPLVQADVGKAGVAIDSVEDMKILFADIDLSQVSVSMTMNGAVLPVLAAFLVAAEESGVALNKISGTIQNDILKEFMVRNTYIYPPKPSMRIVGDIMEFASKKLPLFNSISVSGYHIHEAGADLPLELGLTIADGLEYVKCAQDRSLNIDEFAPRISFFFATGMNFFLEIAKLRAARKIWAQHMLKLGCKDERSLLLRTHCQTSGWSLCASDPYNNIVRTTIEAMASVLGGTQSLHTNSFDEAISLPTPFSAKIARNTQLILQHETGICDVIDPLGGSYYIESLTADIEKQALSIIEKVNQLGGMTKAVEAGVPMQWIEQASLRRQALIDSRQEIRVGENAYLSDNLDEVEVLVINNQEVIKEQTQKLKNLRENRDNNAVNKALENLIYAAKNNLNLLEYSYQAIKHRASVGEVSLALEQVFSRYKTSINPSLGVYKQVYSDKKNLTDCINKVAHVAKVLGRQPRILVAKLGQDGHDRGAKVIASAFSDVGFDVDISCLFETPESIAKQALENDVHVIGVSSLAAGHNTLVPQLLDCLKKLGLSKILVVVGGVIPPQDHEFLLNLGVSDIFGPGTNVLHAAMSIVDKIHDLHQ